MRTFTTPEDCADDTTREALRTSPSQFEEKCRKNAKAGHKQIQCVKCKRWRFPEDRCNLFEAAK